MHPGSNTGDDEVRWDDPAYLSDPRRAYDLLRDRCPVARRPADDVWVITGHAEAAACALDAEGFSNRVSSRLQIPNALDGEEQRQAWVGRQHGARFGDQALVLGPPAANTLECEMLAVHANAILLVAETLTKAKADDLERFARSLKEAGAPLLGAAILP